MQNPLAEYLRKPEMSDAERAAYEAAVVEDEKAAAAFLVDTLSQHLTIAPGQLAEQDPGTGAEREITAGADFARIYGGRLDVMMAAFRAIAAQREMQSAEPVAPTGSDA
jgi:hypothetical protein